MLIDLFVLVHIVFHVSFCCCWNTQLHSNMCLMYHFFVVATTQLHSNNNNTKINLHKLLNFQSLISGLMFLLLLLLLYNYVVLVVFHLSLCIHNYRWTRTKLPSKNKNNNNNNKKIKYVVLLLATRCLYWGEHLTVICLLNCIPQNVKFTLCSTDVDHQMPLPGGMSDCPLHSQLHSSTCQDDLT